MNAPSTPRTIDFSELQKIAEYAKQALDIIEQLVAVGGDVLPLIEQTRERLQAMAAAGRGPSAEEWAAQDTMKEDLNNQLNSDDR